MLWPWEHSTLARKRDVENAHERTREQIEAAKSELKSEMTKNQAPHRSWIASGLAAAIFIASGLLSWQALTGSLSDTPTSVDPGRIGIAVLGETSQQSPLHVSARFSDDNAEAATFIITVSGNPTTSIEPSAPTPRIILYFCGAIRAGLALTEANLGELDVDPLPTGSITQDSALGERSNCSFTVAEFSNGHQTIVVGQSDHPLRLDGGANVLYTLPGVASISIPEEVLTETVYPLPQGSLIDIALTNLPADLSITAAAPLIPASGQTAWSLEAAKTNNPDTYRVVGELASAQKRSQMLLFAAGALSGISGAALLWCLEITISIISERRAAVRFMET